jgi:putative transposase
MPDYVRAYVPGGSYFFTVALLERRRRLLAENIEALREAFGSVRDRRPFRTDAVVILPDHLHCLWTLPPNDSDFSTRWRLIKSSFARAIAPGERLSTRRQMKHERGVWQRRFWEHAIQDQRDYDTHLDYIHFNPVKHGRGSPIGRIRASIDSCAWGCIRRNGRPRRLLGNGIWNDGPDLYERLHRSYIEASVGWGEVRTPTIRGLK